MDYHCGVEKTYISETEYETSNQISNHLSRENLTFPSLWLLPASASPWKTQSSALDRKQTNMEVVREAPKVVSAEDRLMYSIQCNSGNSRRQGSPGLSIKLRYDLTLPAASIAFIEHQVQSQMKDQQGKQAQLQEWPEKPGLTSKSTE
ncbi:hypothetical protein FSARC_4702 [Fusarium sarcochroum]|uniref:Uncharacterized protein n=1 Tax=Fusarium sarcochroum TaxID=1208366 RepID=A0A8H4U1L8_9HYPO|nr:hypothetical protein FSARC_4702 [Fusarium sarcochroum]